MLKIEELTTYYGDRRVLDAVSLEVRSGEVLALIGPNGAGKSTLIRAVSGIISMRSGTVWADGVDLLTLPTMGRARRVAVVPQGALLPPAYSVWETVLMGRTPYLNFLGQVSQKDEQVTRAALEKVDALALLDRRVGELSGGEQQRVLLARALAQSTPILLLDEPTIHLDLQHQVGLMELARGLAHSDRLAILVAVHDLNLAAQYADRAALLVDGRMRASGTPREVLTAGILSDAYHLQVRVVPHPFMDAPLILPEDS